MSGTGCFIGRKACGPPKLVSSALNRCRLPPARFAYTKFSKLRSLMARQIVIRVEPGDRMAVEDMLDRRGRPSGRSRVLTWMPSQAFPFTCASQVSDVPQSRQNARKRPGEDS